MEGLGVVISFLVLLQYEQTLLRILLWAFRRNLALVFQTVLQRHLRAIGEFDSVLPELLILCSAFFNTSVHLLEGLIDLRQGLLALIHGFEPLPRLDITRWNCGFAIPDEAGLTIESHVRVD